MEVFALRYVGTDTFFGKKYRPFGWGPSVSPKFYSRQSSAAQLARTITRRIEYILSQWDRTEPLSNGYRYINQRAYMEKPEKPNFEIVAFELKEVGKIVVEEKR